MKRIVRLTESDLTRIVRRVIMEQTATTPKNNDYNPTFLGHVGVDANTSLAFYKDPSYQAKQGDGAKILRGVTHQEAFKKYDGQLELFCPGKRYPNGQAKMYGQDVTLSNNWTKFCK